MALPENKLDFGESFGNALAQTAHGRYYAQKADLEAGEDRRRQAAQPYIQGAISGDKSAMGQVAAGDPRTAAIITQIHTRMDANQRADAKARAEFTTLGANAILSTAPGDREAVYQQVLAEGARRGIDLSHMPQNYSPTIDPMLRTQRGLSTEWLKIDQQNKLEDRKDARHNSPGGINQGTEVWGTPGPAAPAAPAAPPRATSPRVSDVAPETVPPGTASGSITATNQTAAAPVGQPSPGPLAPEGVTPGAPPIGGAPDGFRPMGHRDPQGNLVPAHIDGKPVFRNPQTGELRLGDAAPPPVQMAQATPPVAPSAGNAAAGTRTSPRVVYEDPAVQGGQIGQFRAPNGKTELIVGPGGTSIYKMPDGSFQAWRPGLKTEHFSPGYEADPVAPGRWRAVPGGPADKQGPEIDPTLRGKELFDSLEPAEAAQVNAVLEGRAPLPTLSARMAPETKRLRTLVFQADPNFDSTVYASRAATQKDMADGKLAVQRTAADKLINHIGELHEQSAELNNSKTPLFNSVGNLIAANRGDPRIAKFETTKHLVLEEADKFFSGTGGTTVSGMESMKKLINNAQSPQQLQGAMEQLSKLMNGQLSAMAEQYNRGMRYTGDKAVAPESLLSKQAQETLAKVNANPLGQKKPDGDAGNLKKLYGLE